MPVAVTHKPDHQDLPLTSKTSLDYIVVDPADDVEWAVPIEIAVGSCRDPKLVAIAGVHGDEIDGIVALQEVWREIDPARLRGTLIVVPVANPRAVKAGLRCAPQDGLDLNRLFPGEREGSWSHRLAYHVFHDVVMVADLLVTFHGWFKSGLVIPYTEFPQGIGDARVERASLAAAQAFGFGVLRVTPDQPGRLLSEAVRAGVPAIESEIGGLGMANPDNWGRYHVALFDLMQHLGMWPGEKKRRAEPFIVSPCTVKSPVHGFVRHQVDLNTWVNEGQLLARVVDLRGRTLAEIHAPSRALVAVQRLWPAVSSDDMVAILFETIAPLSQTDQE